MGQKILDVSMTDLIMVFKLGSWNPGVLRSNEGITEEFSRKRQCGISGLLPCGIVALLSCLLHEGDKFLWKERFQCFKKEPKSCQIQNKKFHVRKNTCKNDLVIV